MNAVTGVINIRPPSIGRVPLQPLRRALKVPESAVITGGVDNAGPSQAPELGRVFLVFFRGE